MLKYMFYRLLHLISVLFIVSVLVLNLFGDGLGDILEPRLPEE